MRAPRDPFAELENVFADPGSKPDEPAVQTPPVLPGSNADPKPWPGRAPEPNSTVEAMAEPRPGVPFDGEDEEEDGDAGYEPMERRRNFAPLIAAVVALVVLAGGGYAVWLNKDDFKAMLGIDGGQTLASAPAAGDPTAPAAAKKAVNDANATGEGVEKFTQRLNSDGSEVDEGPAGGIASLGEGTSVASVTPGPTPPADGAAVADPAAPAIADPAAPAIRRPGCAGCLLRPISTGGRSSRAGRGRCDCAGTGCARCGCRDAAGHDRPGRSGHRSGRARHRGGRQHARGRADGACRRAHGDRRRRRCRGGPEGDLL